MRNMPYTETEIFNYIMTEDDQLKKAVLELYNLQTNAEKENDITLIRNGIGFNCVDSRFMTGISKQLLRTNTLSSRQLYATRIRIIKYIKQLTRIANNKLLMKSK